MHLHTTAWKLRRVTLPDCSALKAITSCKKPQVHIRAFPLAQVNTLLHLIHPSFSRDIYGYDRFKKMQGSPSNSLVKQWKVWKLSREMSGSTPAPELTVPFPSVLLEQRALLAQWTRKFSVSLLQEPPYIRQWIWKQASGEGGCCGSPISLLDYKLPLHP